MGFLFGGGQSKQSSSAGSFGRYEKQSAGSFDGSLRKANFSLAKRKEIMGAVGDQFKGGKRISNDKILRKVGVLGYDVKRDVQKNALTVKNDNSRQKEMIKQAALNRNKAQIIRERMQIENINKSKILGSVMGKSANQALNDARKGEKGSAKDLGGVGNGRSSSVSILSSSKGGGFAGSQK
jgi:hypothetical protein